MNKFKDITTSDYKGMSRGEPIVLDVKGIVEKPTWRLLVFSFYGLWFLVGRRERVEG